MNIIEELCFGNIEANGKAVKYGSVKQGIVVTCKACIEKLQKK